jgi:hypothetical protein
MRPLAIRIFSNPNPLNGIEYEVKDRMVRKPCGSFYLIEGPGRPGESEVVTPYSLQAVYNWLSGFAVADRSYGGSPRLKGEEYKLRDRMLRKACGSFVLMVAGEVAG